MIAALTLTLVLAPQKSMDDRALVRERGGQTDAIKNAQEGLVPPAIDTKIWRNTPKNQPLPWSQMKGKVVLVVLWSFWDKEGKKAAPLLEKLRTEYSRTLVIVGVHSDVDTAKGLEAAKALKYKFPLAFDEGKFLKMMGGDGYPDYILIDKRGKTRVVDLANAYLESAVKVLVRQK